MKPTLIRPALVTVALTHLVIPVATTFRDGGLLAGIPFTILAVAGFWAAFDTKPPRGSLNAQVVFWVVLFGWQLAGALTIGGFWLAWWGVSFLLCLAGSALSIMASGAFEGA